MPWKASDASKHTKKANTPAEAKTWAATANSVLKDTGDEARAIRTANAAIKKKR
jgi:hypothetical protein